MNIFGSWRLVRVSEYSVLVSSMLFAIRRRISVGSFWGSSLTGLGFLNVLGSIDVVWEVGWFDGI